MSPDLDTLYYGDCLDWMQHWDDQSIDLIYLDPPFNSKAQYNVLFGKSGGIDAQYRAFNDTWVWDDAAANRLDAIAHPAHRAILGLHTMLGECGMLGYLTYMAERLAEMHRLMKPTGSIYLHCDPTASHYLKALMDEIIVKQGGGGGFRNEVIWHYRTGGAGKNHFSKKHDVILFYGKGPNSCFNVLKEKAYTKSKSRKPGIINYGAGNAEFFKDDKGVFNYVNMRDVWDIPYINSQSKERVGYPTQKPIALLDRIIRASSNPNDVVMDPFCGCGTAVESARNLNRRFIGIDISAFAIDLIRQKRMGMSIPAKGIPVDMYSARLMAKDNPFQFESWAVTRLPGFAPNTKQVGDGGVDGRGKLAVRPDDLDSDLALAQAKGGKFNLGNLHDFLHVIQRDNAAIGCYITLDRVTSKEAIREATNAGTCSIGIMDYKRMNLWSIEDHFDDRRLHMPPMRDPYNGKAIHEDRIRDWL